MESRGEMRDGSMVASATQSMLKVAGGIANVTGPGVFMLRAMIAGSTSAAFIGLTGAVAGSIIWGTASLPFIVASSVGFVLGTFNWYRMSIKHAMLALDAQPALLRLHLDMNYPLQRFKLWPMESFKSQRFQGSWVLQSMLMVAWLTAQPALDEVNANEEEVIITREREKIREECDEH